MKKMRPPKNAIILIRNDQPEKTGAWGLWLDGSGKTDWSQTHIHLETSAAFAVIYSAEHGAYAMYLGVDKGRPHPTPETIRKLGISCIVEASEARPGSWSEKR